MADSNVIELGPHGLFTAASFAMFGTPLQRGVEDDVGNKIRKLPDWLREGRG